MIIADIAPVLPVLAPNTDIESKSVSRVWDGSRTDKEKGNFLKSFEIRSDSCADV